MPVGGEIFRTCPDRPWGPHSLLNNGCRVFPGRKERSGRNADPSPLLVPYALYRASVPVQAWPLPFIFTLRPYYALLCSQNLVLLVHCFRHTSVTQTLPQRDLSSPVCNSSGYSMRWCDVLEFIHYSTSSAAPINNLHSPSSKDTSDRSCSWYHLRLIQFG